MRVVLATKEERDTYVITLRGVLEKYHPGAIHVEPIEELEVELHGPDRFTHRWAFWMTMCAPTRPKEPSKWSPPRRFKGP